MKGHQNSFSDCFYTIFFLFLYSPDFPLVFLHVHTTFMLISDCYSSEDIIIFLISKHSGIFCSTWESWDVNLKSIEMTS